MSPHRDTLAAIARLKSGEDELSAEQYTKLLEAVEEAVRALILAPSGTDSVASGVWYHHERGPALARLADALSPHPSGAADRLADEQMSDREVLRELHAALLKSSR
jgi:hypothetical protein